MKKEILKVSIRQSALLIPVEKTVAERINPLNETTSVLLANCTKLGFTFSERLLQAVNGLNPKDKVKILEVLKEITGINKNWTPLVQQWDIPTGESVMDHVITFFANLFKSNRGVTLPCGHTIPDNTFPLERYNGCPYCGTPFVLDKLEYTNSSNKLKVLDLWSEEDVLGCFKNLLESPVALDATQSESLRILLGAYSLPKEVVIRMKETSVLVIDTLVDLGKANEAANLFKSPTDILRYLWYKHTGFLQIVEPKTIAKRLSSNAKNRQFGSDREREEKIRSMADLKLKFNRSECKMYASWLNSLSLDVQKQCELMHPKRGIWVRVIRALRLAEYSKKEGFERLANVLDVFYNEKYEVWQAKYEKSRLKYDAVETFKLLKNRPGLFARSLFSNMLWFGGETSIEHFREVSGAVPLRLIVTLNMYAENYFVKHSTRSVKPLGGINKRIPSNKLLDLYADEDLQKMQSLVKELTLEVLEKKFKAEENASSSVFIEKGLFNIPLAIGDRSETVQDLPSALMGTRFPVEGSTVRLFLQWGEGLSAQHLDMDLSCRVAYGGKSEFCSYSQLVIPGCKHSGDIQYIPEKVGTAEYIDVNMEQLASRGAKYVVFTCNAYTNGSLTPDLVVGWMDSQFPMKISKSGVAYNPSDVQHQVRITSTVSKGLVFGVLDIEKREVVWLEMSFSGQLTHNLDIKGTETLLRKLDAKIKVGDVLQIRANAQGQKIVTEKEDADEVFDLNWATDSAQVAKIILD